MLIAFVTALACALSATAAINPIIDAEDRGLYNASAITTALASGHRSERIAAATALGRIQVPEVIDPLFGVLTHDRDSGVAAAAAFALGQLSYDPAFNGGRSPEIVAALTDALEARSSDSQSFARFAPDAIGALGKLTAPDTTSSVVSKYLSSSSDDDTQEQAILAIYRSWIPGTAALSDTVVAQLRSLAISPSERVRRALSFLVNRLNDPRLVDVARLLLSDAKEFVRYPSAGVLSRIGQGSADDIVLVGLLADSSEHVRVAALNAIIASKRAELLARPELERLVNDASFHVRSVLAGVERFTGELMADSSATVRAAALTSFVAASGDSQASKDALRMALLDTSFVVRIAAINAAATLPSESADPFLQAGVADSELRVFYTVLEAYASVPYPNDWIQPAISKALTLPPQYLRNSAVDALGALTPAASAKYVFQQYVATPKTRQYQDVRQGLIDVLVNIKTDESTSYLISALSDPHAAVTADARAELQSRGVVDLPVSPLEALELSPFRDTTFTSNPRAHLNTTKGAMTIELFAADAPLSVSSFVGLAESGTFDGLIFHRVVDNFVIQGLDPDGFGYGDPGYSLRSEINGRVYERGTVGYARTTSFASDGCQIFVAHVPIPRLDGKYTVIGQVVEGLDVIDLIEIGDVVSKVQIVR